uniref:C2 calcium/lipid-binding domain, CaLB n=1 Tax=Tanacetum cinerariifolium TaxID=118510 RepID=A0A699HK55_TANCI|nr:C2 calcium/lipid-binding domain, CaLB [Tanacetum cinerariifolium]
MTKVIKGKFEKLDSNGRRLVYDVEIAEVTNIPCDLKKEDDLEQQMSHESDNDMEYDPSDFKFTKWLASKFFNYKKMDHYAMKALWTYLARGDDEVELVDEKSTGTDDEDEVANIFRNETNVFEFETPLCRAFKEFNYLLQIDPDKQTSLPRFSMVRSGKLKEEALKNKAIIDGMIDEDDESSNEGWKDGTTLTIPTMIMMKDEEEYEAIKENEYDDLMNTRKEAIHTYQEIVRMMDEGWRVTRIE